MSKAIAGGVFVVVICCVLFFGSMVLERSSETRANRAQLAARELDVREAEAEQARAAAEVLPDAIRAEYYGKAGMVLVKGQADRSADMTDALILLATEETRARDGWRLFAQMVGAIVAMCGVLFVPMLYRQQIADLLTRQKDA